MIPALYRPLGGLQRESESVSASGIKTHVEIADQDRISGQVIGDYETGGQRVGNPMEHANSISYDRTQVGIKVDGHHCFIWDVSMVYVP
jgi:hypothetical protein